MSSNQTLSLEHYLNSEKGAPKNELLRGRLYSLPEIDDNYFAVRMNLAFLLNEHFSKSDYKVHVGETKLYIEAAKACLYPDILVSCDNKPEHPLYKTQANLLVEVVNQACNGYKLGYKLACYRRVPNVTEILVVSSEQAHVEYLCREDDRWILKDFAEQDKLFLPGVAFACAVAEIYQDVFDE